MQPSKSRSIFCSLLLAGAILSAQSLASQSVMTTLLALKDPKAPRKVLSAQLAEQMMAQAKPNQSPSRAAVQRFSEDLTGALLGRDITVVRASALKDAIAHVMQGKGPTFVPATSVREVLTSCGVEQPTVQGIVKRFIDIGHEVSGPDDMPVREKLRP
jgi:hypothetical protein